MPTLSEEGMESLHFLHNTFPLASGLSHTVVKFKALICMKLYCLTRNYYLMALYVAIPLCLSVCVPKFTCYRLLADNKKVTVLDLSLLNGSTVIYQNMEKTNFSSAFEHIYQLAFQDGRKNLNIKFKKVKSIPSSRSSSIKQDIHPSVSFVLVGCKFLPNVTGRNDSWLAAIYNGQFDYAESFSISTNIVAMALKTFGHLTSNQTVMSLDWEIEPLPYTFFDNIKKSSRSAHHRCKWIAFALLVAINAFSVGLGFLVMVEARAGFVLLKQISGMSNWDYYFSTLVFDITQYIVVCFLISISLIWFRSYPPSMLFDKNGFFLLTVFSALVTLPSVYTIQAFFNSFTIFVSVYLLGSLTIDLFTVAYVDIYTEMPRDLRHVLLRVVYPPFNVFLELYINCCRRSRPIYLFSTKFYSNNCTHEWFEPFPVEFIVIVILQFSLWLLLVIIADVVSRLSKLKCFQSCMKIFFVSNKLYFEDMRVVKDLMFMKDLHILMKTSSKLKNKWEIPKNELYGLLETSGTMKDVFVVKLVHYYRRPLCGYRAGYCPHNPVLMDSLTCYETLKLFGQLRGLGSHDLDTQIDSFFYLFNLKNVTHQCTVHLSMSDKKKLNLAIALIGNPTVIIMNEPTELFDVITTNLAWGMLRHLSREHRFILMATKFARECQSICTQVSIVHGGQLIVQSDMQDLVDKYFHGYTATLKFRKSKQQKSTLLKTCFSRLVEIFPNVEIYSDETNTHLYFTSDDTDLSKTIAFLEDAKVYYSLWDYTLNKIMLNELVLYLAFRFTEQIVEILPEF